MQGHEMLRAATIGIALLMAGPSLAHDSHNHSHDHDTAHSHASDAASAVYKGVFEDEQVKDRTLADWQGDWQSVYPLLMDGSLDAVMAHKAEHGDKSAAAYRDYYQTGYQTDVDRIEIAGDAVTFHRGDAALSGSYASDGHEILTYEAGNRGVRYVFRKVSGDAGAPAFIQFSDHAIAPVAAGHFHLYWGDDRAALLGEVTNWPTYYPAAMAAGEVAAEMMAH